ncbi:hypothetical protein GBF38_022001 [Nibea albiflora]|uniref:Uncharacterized protein n=1 Tax=Nibea albiflora TaxID=240163 RepID=A0ACB7FGL6_NIBAL|nr:hypothetical protein GBF38_022001 [Nibea albiflora]
MARYWERGSVGMGLEVHRLATGTAGRKCHERQSLVCHALLRVACQRAAPHNVAGYGKDIPQPKSSLARPAAAAACCGTV